MTAEREVEDLLSSICNGNYEYKLLTATEFKDQHTALSKYSSVQIGKCLNKLGYECERKRINKTIKRVYTLPVLKTNWINYSNYGYDYQANSSKNENIDLL